MKILAISAFFILLISFTVSAQNNKAPTFQQYRVRVEKIKPRIVNLASNKSARMYRTNLRIASGKGVNFAGHFMLTYWGCGTNCLTGAIIDARKGRVFFPAQLQGAEVGLSTWAENIEALEFKPNSSLLILNGYEGGELNTKHRQLGIHYYKWNGSILKKIKFIRKDSE